MNTLRNLNTRYKAFKEKYGLVYEFASSILIAYVLVILMTNFLIYPVSVDGTSMYPTLRDRDYGFSNLLSYRSQSIQRFDVVIIYYAPINEYLIKRVIGLPGDIVEYRNDILYINNEPIRESYLLDTLYAKQYEASGEPYTADFGPILVKEGQVFIMGDNRLPGGSTDSRVFGTLAISNIKSKDVYVLWPLNHFRWITGQ